MWPQAQGILRMNWSSVLCLSLIISKDRPSWQETFDNCINKGSLWTIKKAEHQRIDAFELWCWRRLLRVPWTARRSNQSILKEISPGCSYGRTDVEAVTPIPWPPDAKSWLTRKDPDAGKDWRWEEKGTTEEEMAGWHHWLDGHVWVSSESWWWTGRPGVLPSMGSQRVGPDWAT